MTITTQVNKQLGSISIGGRFDFLVHREFKQAYTEMLNNSAIHEIEVNMRGTNFIDSAALGMLMLLRERAHAVNKSVALSHPSGSVSTLLEVANFDKIFSIKNAVPLSGHMGGLASAAS